jgi:hypothetical protein
VCQKHQRLQADGPVPCRLITAQVLPPPPSSGSAVHPAHTPAPRGRRVQSGGGIVRGRGRGRAGAHGWASGRSRLLRALIGSGLSKGR